MPKRTTAPLATQRTSPRAQSSRRRIRRRAHDEVSDEQLVRRAQHAPALLRPAELLRLQSVAGNRAVTGHISRLVDTGLARRQTTVQRDPVLLEDEKQNQPQDVTGTGGGYAVEDLGPSGVYTGDPGNSGCTSDQSTTTEMRSSRCVRW